MSEQAVLLPRALKRRLVADARKALPRECCGLLVGRGRDVCYAVAMANVDRNPARFRISDAAHIELRRLLRSFMPALEIVGVYHSHPAGPARLSERDLREAHYPAWIHLVIGLAARRATVRAFVIRRAASVPIPIRWHEHRRRLRNGRGEV